MTKYVEDTYKRIAHIYADRFFDDTTDLPFIDILIKQLRPGAKILDIGSGPGQFSKYLLEHGYHVEGIDTSPEMIAIAKDKVPSVTFTEMDMRKLVFPDQRFDAVLAAYSIIHIPTAEVATVLAEIRRVLKPGGVALFIAQEGEPDHVVDDPLAEGEKIFINFFVKERLARELEIAGFNVVSQTVLGQTDIEVLSATAVGTLATPAA